MIPKKVFAIKQTNENRIKKLCPEADRKSGIYCLYRTNEQGFRFAYIGLATKSVLSRLADHLQGYSQHIDLSIRKYKLYDAEKNPYGYKIKILCYCNADECNAKEQEYIRQFADAGYQLKNVSGGSQGVGKFNLHENKPSKGYHDGLNQGYKNAQKYVANLFDKHLVYQQKSDKPNKNQEKAMAKFAEFLQVGSDAE